MRRTQREQCIIPLLLLIIASLLIYTTLLVEHALYLNQPLWNTLLTRGSVMVFMANAYIGIDLYAQLIKPRSRLNVSLRFWPSRISVVFLSCAVIYLYFRSLIGGGLSDTLLLQTILVILQLVTPLVYVIFWCMLLPRNQGMVMRIIFWTLFSVVYLGIALMEGAFWGNDQVDYVIHASPHLWGLIVSLSGFSFWIALAFLLQFSGEWILFHLPKKH